jgi:chromosome segregation ATPase
MDEEKKKAIQEEVVNANNKSLEERIRTLEERNIEMMKAIFFLTNKNRNLKNKHNTLRKKVKDIETKLSRV